MDGHLAGAAVTSGLRKPPQEARKGLQGLLKQAGPQPHQAPGKGPLPRSYETLPGLLGAQSHISGAKAWVEPQKARGLSGQTSRQGSHSAPLGTEPWAPGAASFPGIRAPLP